jgi:hypothetical protein
MGIGKSKEGFSVYGMMQSQCTTLMVSEGARRGHQLRPGASGTAHP